MFILRCKEYESYAGAAFAHMFRDLTIRIRPHLTVSLSGTDAQASNHCGDDPDESAARNFVNIPSPAQAGIVLGSRSLMRGSEGKILGSGKILSAAMGSVVSSSRTSAYPQNPEFKKANPVLSSTSA